MQTAPAVPAALRKQARAPVASYLHTLALLAIMFAALGVPFLLQHSANSGVAPSGPSASPHLIPSFLESLAFDWGMFFFAWFGARQKGGNLCTLSVGRWSSLREVLRDLAIAAPFWVVWEATAHFSAILLGLNRGGPASAWITPRGILELGWWFAVSVSAGFCEEVVFRGYLQQQFSALTGSVWFGLLGQAIVFGMIHPFKGWRFAAVVSVLGVLYGLLAMWRKDLKPGMVAHAWSDVWEGWLKHALKFPH